MTNAAEKLEVRNTPETPLSSNLHRIYLPHIRETERILIHSSVDPSWAGEFKAHSKSVVWPHPLAEDLHLQSYGTLGETPEESFDVVIAHHTLENSLDPVELIRQQKSKLTVRGRLILCLPIDDWRNQRVIDPNATEKHFFTWTPLTIGNLLYELGFEVEKSLILTQDWVGQRKRSEKAPVWLEELTLWIRAWRFRRRQVLVFARKD